MTREPYPLNITALIMRPAEHYQFRISFSSALPADEAEEMNKHL